MKKIILSSVLFLSQLATAQTLVWGNTFDTPASLQGWTFHDLNNNSNGWLQGQNIYHNGTSMVYGTAGVLRHSMSLVPTGSATGFATENDWIITPEIDLTNTTGTLTLTASIGRQRTTHTVLGRDLYIFVSTPQKPIPTIADFQAMTVDGAGNDLPSPYKLQVGGSTNPFPTDLTQFVENLVDLSAFAGKKIYIGMWSNRKPNGNNIQNINIDEMGIYAYSFLSTKEVKRNKTVTQIIENPVKETLYVKLNPELKENNTIVTIYNTTAQKVLTTQYSKSINVAGLSAGIYITEISDGKTTEQLKFIKK
ncbi:secretion protein [Chryseobacterium lactis]|uniref:Secretion protein n=1 Tax=Chryseobacterium lactis TaxID=1241981 RepID=A0A3G6RQ90_CHRLC|nr:T9SS type A sorting domain-containing protein [Chryseobacterium lactis]AZA83225.1 T9SS C-terminal target domain-containing protein [Chryseobacterium lactis]AZB03610.1 T9SS C-terminal target domain-containing protein [Chryseobacterium lactis]PNW11179.1 secretion protein [Chryseobacterium lactis]